MAHRRRTLSIQVFVRVRKPKHVKVTREFLDEVVTRWVYTGEQVPGTEVKAVHWRRDGGRDREANTDVALEDVRVNLLQRMIGLLGFSVAEEEDF